MPTARRLSQTLGHAKSPIMKARSPFVVSHALSRKTPVAPGRFEVGAPSIRCAARAVARDTSCRRCFSSLARLPEVTTGVGSGWSVLRRPAHGRVIPKAGNYGAPVPWRIHAVSIFGPSSSGSRPACASGVGMLRHANAKQGCASTSVA